MEERNTYNDFTINEYVESNKAKHLYECAKKQARKYILFSLLSFFIGTIMAVLFSLSGSFIIGIITFFVGIIFIIVFSEKYKAFLAPYQKVYETALKNDEIRYAEKIKFLERKRLETEYNNDNSIESLKESIKVLPQTLENPKPPVIKKEQ